MLKKLWKECRLLVRDIIWLIPDALYCVLPYMWRKLDCYYDYLEKNHKWEGIHGNVFWAIERVVCFFSKIAALTFQAGFYIIDTTYEMKEYY